MYQRLLVDSVPPSTRCPSPPSTQWGGDSRDSVEGLETGSGNDTITYTQSRDNTINTGAGDDTINGGRGNDSVDGAYGNDLLVVDYSQNTYPGGNYTPGISSYVYSNATGESHGYFRARKDNNGNYDRVSFEKIERFQVTGTNYADTINGGSGNDILNGGGGSDTLNGRAGDDTLNAGLGSSDTVDGGAGTDVLVVNYSTLTTNINQNSTSIQTSGNQTTYSNIEQFNLTGGSGNDSLYGGSLADTLVGNGGNDTLSGGAGNDILNGGAGADRLDGGNGNDTYIVDTTTDTITEMATGGIDTVQSAVSYTLGATSNLENLTLQGSALNGTGNSLNNAIAGNSGANTLTGNGGNDTLNGGAGIDTLIGGDGNDVFVGGFGNDMLTGSAGNDRFTFNAFNEGIDTIVDFNKTVDDIYVSAAGFGGGLVANNAAIAASGFLAGSGVTAATNSNQRFIYNTSNGALFFDADGNGTGSAAIQIAKLTNAPGLANTDIFVIA